MRDKNSSREGEIERCVRHTCAMYQSKIDTKKNMFKTWLLVILAVRWCACVVGLIDLSWMCYYITVLVKVLLNPWQNQLYVSELVYILKICQISSWLKYIFGWNFDGISAFTIGYFSEEGVTTTWFIRVFGC